MWIRDKLEKFGIRKSDKIFPKNIPSDIPNDIKKEILNLLSTSAEERALASLNLGEMGKDAIPAIPFLIKTLSDNVMAPWARFWRIRTLGRYPHDIFHFSAETSPAEEAKKALIKIGDSVIEPLIDALECEDQGIRAGVASMFQYINELSVVTSLINALTDKHSSVRANALFSLYKLEGSRAEGYFIEALKETVPDLIESLIDSNARVRHIAAKALCEIRDKRVAVTAVIEKLKDSDPEVRKRTEQALEMMIAKKKTILNVNVFLYGFDDRVVTLKLGKTSFPKPCGNCGYKGNFHYCSTNVLGGSIGGVFDLFFCPKCESEVATIGMY